MFGRKKYPEKYVGEYLVSKQTAPSKILPLLISPKIEEERQKAKLHRTEEWLKAKREEYKNMRASRDEQWERLAREEMSLKRNFVRFNNFVIENMEKRTRVSQCLEGHKQLVEERENNVRELRTSIGHTRQHLFNLQEEVRSHTIYEKFLNTVVDMSKEEGFRNVYDIIERYEYYLELGTKLAEKQAQQFMIIQNAKVHLLKFREEKQDVILGLHTQAASLQGRYEDAVRKTRELENLVCRIKDRARDNYTDAKTTKATIWNLYKIMCRKKGITPKIQTDDFEKQLIFISKILQQYKYMNSEFLKTIKKSSLTKRQKKK